MFKFALPLAILVFSNFAAATTNVLFSADKARIVIEGPPVDLDSTELFNAIKLPGTDGGSTLEKKVEINADDGSNLFTVECRLSKSTADDGSCTIVVPKSAYATVDAKRRRVFLMFGLPTSEKAAQAFMASQDGHIFMSSDSHVGLIVNYSSSGTPIAFRLFFN